MWLGSRVNPAGVDATVQGLSNLGVNRRTEADQASERRLDMAARAAKPVVEIEVPEGGIEVIAPHQSHHAAAKPNALRIAGRAVDSLGCFREFVDFTLTVLGNVGWGLFGRLFLSLGVTALGRSGPDPDQKGEGRQSDALKKSNSKPGTNATHEVPVYC